MKRPHFSVASAHELPEDLPVSEHVLWQGAPAWWPLTRSLHVGAVAAYFVLLLAWYATDQLLKNAHGSWHGLLLLTALASVPPVLLFAYAWLVAHTTSYTLTNRRLIVQVGVALPISFNVPFGCIESAALKPRHRGAGDIAVSLAPGKRLSYVALWPHVRSGHAGRGAEPVLRAVPHVERVGRLMARLLEATQPVVAAPPTAPSSVEPEAATSIPRLTVAA